MTVNDVDRKIIMTTVKVIKVFKMRLVVIMTQIIMIGGRVINTFEQMIIIMILIIIVIIITIVIIIVIIITLLQ